jgi:hypothetical protein
MAKEWVIFLKELAVSMAVAYLEIVEAYACRKKYIRRMDDHSRFAWCEPHPETYENRGNHFVSNEQSEQDEQKKFLNQ